VNGGNKHHISEHTATDAAELGSCITNVASSMASRDAPHHTYISSSDFVL